MNSNEGRFLELCRSVREGRVVFWVGAGFSEYAGYPSGKEFTKHLQQILGIPEDEDQLLSEVSEKFTNRKNLLEIIIKKFGKEPAHTYAHESLALITQIPYIITTNYDMLFETVYGDKIKSIADESELPTTAGVALKTFIYKIHGDISHLDQIIITLKDYQEFDANSLLWDKIKTILAEYSVVFVGYSLKDKNVQELLELVFNRIGEHTNPYYFITRGLTDDMGEFLQKYNIIPIELEATTAIIQITEYVARYAFVDHGTDPIQLARNSPILEHKSVKVSSIVDGDKLTACTINTTPDSGFKVMATSQKLPSIPDSTEIHEWFDLIAGVRFDPVTINDPWSKINLGVQAGDVIIFNKSEGKLKINKVTLIPHPKKTYHADLQVDDIRFSNTLIKEYESETHAQIVFEHEGFSFFLYAQKNQNTQEVTVEFGFKMENEYLDIDKAKETYSFIKKWIDGQLIHVIRYPRVNSWVVESLPLKDSEFYQDIQFRQRLFEILSNIQKISKVKLTIPEIMSREDLQKVFEIGAFIDGKKHHQGKISCRMTPLRSDFLYESQNIPQVTIKGVMDFTLFGQKISLNYVIEGTKCYIENLEDVVAQKEQGILPLNVVLSSSNDDLYLRFRP